MRRDVKVKMDLEAVGPARLTLSLAPAGGAPADERISVRQGDDEVLLREVDDLHGGRLHVCEVDTGPVRIEYSATVIGDPTAPVCEPIDEIRYLRPSRYCESDVLRPIAIAEFGGIEGEALLAAVSSWVGVNIAYLPGSSLPTDGAVRTLLSRQGVCRDFAHLVVAFLRALDVPARVVSVYAPGLAPMDFHAVAEAAVDGAWHVVDATARAPRGTLLRIATGRDAADTAFLASRGEQVRLDRLEVTAVADELPDDDMRRLAVLH